MKLNELLRLGSAIEQLAEVIEIHPIEIVSLLEDHLISEEDCGELRNYFESGQEKKNA